MEPIWRCFAVSCLLLTLSVQTEAERSKQWESENGVPSYGDLVPPEAIQRGYREFDGRGIKRREVAPTGLLRVA